MPKFRKLIKSASLVLIAIVLVFGALILAASVFGDGMVQVAIENAGIKALRTAVTIEKTRLSLLRGSLSIEDLTIDNPAGYPHKVFLTLKRGDTRVKTLSLLSDKIMIRDLTLDGIDVILEPNGVSSNLQDILNALHNATFSGKPLYVGNLEITNVTVNMMLPSASGLAQAIPLKLSPIRMTDLGRDERLDMAILTRKILTAIASRIAEQGGQLLPKEVAGPLGSVLDKAVGFGKTLIGVPSSTATDNPNESSKSETRLP
jgi:uncharacterized protein involved in outer membrane biogenesis